MKKRIEIFIRPLSPGLLVACLAVFTVSCNKEETPGGGGTTNPTDSTVNVVVPNDPATAETIGLFMENWAPRNFTAPAYEEATAPAAAIPELTVDASVVLTKIPPTLFANNANIWMGNFTDAPLLNHLRLNKPGVIRFPGGSISDIYFWNAEKDKKPATAPSELLNADGVASPAGYWYGRNDESWTCALDRYYTMLNSTGNKGMITVNYGYARYGTGTNPVADAAHLAADWVRYDAGRTKYWEVGNENNGSWEAGYRIDRTQNKDGQPEYITGDLYGRHVKVFVDSMKKAAREIGATIYIGAQLVEHPPAGWEPAATQSWNAGVLPQVKDVADFYIVHSYYTPFKTNASPELILGTASTISKEMKDYLNQTIAAAAGVQKPVALTEYNITSEGSMQQVSQVAGMHAVMVMGEMMRNQFGFTARWDLANGWSNGNDHGLFNNGDEPGVPKWNPRPAFYYLYYFQKFLGDRYVPSTMTGGTGLVSYASTFSSGEIAVAIVNTTATAQAVRIKYKNFNAGERFYWYTLTGGTDATPFSRQVIVNGQGPSTISGGPANYETLKPFGASAKNGVRVSMPARSVVYLVIDNK